MKVLMVFPIVAVEVGGSKVASAIIAEQTTGTTTTLASGSEEAVNGIIAAAVLTVPFFVIPGLLSKSLEAAGSFGKKLSGMSQKANSRIGSKAKSKGKERWNNSYVAKNFAERKKLAATRRARITGGTYEGSNPISRIRSGISGRLNSSSLSGQAGNRLANAGNALEVQEFNEQVKAAAAGFEAKDHDNIVAMGMTGKDASGKKVDDATRVAAIEYTAKAGSFNDVASMSTSDKDSTAVISAVTEAFKAKGLQNVAGSAVLEQVRKGTNQETVQSLVRQHINNGSMTAANLTQSESSTKFVADAVTAKPGEMTTEGKDHLQNAVDNVYKNESTRKATNGKIEASFTRMGTTVPPSGGTP